MMRKLMFILILVVLAGSVLGVRELDCNTDFSNCNGLVSYWRLNDAGKELSSGESLGSGLVGLWHLNDNTLTDTSGLGNDGTAQGGLDCSGDDSVFDDGCEMDGDDDYISAGNDNSLDITDAITISTWVKSPNWRPTDNWRALLDKEYYGFYVLNNADKVRLQIRNSTNGLVTGDTGVLEKNRWYHIVGTYDKDGGTNNYKLYVDGEVVQQKTFGGPIKISTNDLEIGEYVGYYFNGSLDEVAIWNRSLSSSEIEELYQRGAPVDEQGVNNGTNLGPLSTTGKLSNALSFDGVDDYVEVDDESSLDFSGADNYTFSIWVYLDDLTDTGTSRHPIIFERGEYQVGGYCFQANANTKVYFITNSAGVNTGTTSLAGTVTTGEWIHLTFVKNGTTGKIYKNGQDVTVFSNDHTGMVNSNENLTIGAYTPATDRFHVNGSLDDFTVWNRALSANEVANLYNLSRIPTYTSFGLSIDPYTTDLDDVASFRLNKSEGKIEWVPNVKVAGQDFDSYVTMGDQFVSLDTTNLDSTYDNTAIITMYGVDCANFNRDYLSYKSGYPTSKAEVLGNRCPEAVCTSYTCDGTELNFTVTGFSGYAYGANANLTISNDGPKDNETVMTFTATYTNNTGGITGGECNISTPEYGLQAMSDQGSGNYQKQYTFSVVGTDIEYNITCAKSGFTELTAYDNYTVTEAVTGSPSSGIPEFNDYAIVLILVLAIAGFFYFRRKK